MEKSLIQHHANSFQGSYKKVLCVCSAGLLRSATTAFVLSQEPYNFNTRAAGISSSALIQVNSILLSWADEIVVMEENHYKYCRNLGTSQVLQFEQKPIIVLGIEDRYSYRDPELMQLIKDGYRDPKKSSNATIAQ